MRSILYTLVLCFGALNSYAWNAAGHKIVAQIAFDNLSPNAKIMCDKYLPRHYGSLNARFVASSTWMDKIRFREIYWFDAMHYIDIPFSTDKSRLPPVESTNAVWAINKARAVFSSKKTNTSDKRFALRMLIHIIGDIHQPLHAVTKVSAQLPKGDLGGNLFPLGKNPVGDNLHKYWDNGAGLFIGRYDVNQVRNRARQLEQQWPCAEINTQTNPEKWAKKSNLLAIKNVYQINPQEVPGERYQANAQSLVQKQVVFAGCRLAAVLNQIAQK